MAKRQSLLPPPEPPTWLLVVLSVFALAWAFLFGLVCYEIYNNADMRRQRWATEDKQRELDSAIKEVVAVRDEAESILKRLEAAQPPLGGGTFRFDDSGPAITIPTVTCDADGNCVVN